MRDARQRISEALTDSGRGDRETALLVLRHAMRWAAHALDGADSPYAAGDAEDTDGADALTALYALDDALTDARDLADALPALLRSARAGERLGRGTQDLMAELTSLAERVAVERAALDEVRARETELRQRLAEHEKLRHEVDELRRLERLVAELDELRAQHTEIDTRLRELRAQDPDTADRELHTGADSLLRLTEQQLSVLAPRTRQALEQVAAGLSPSAHSPPSGQGRRASLAERRTRRVSPTSGPGSTTRQRAASSASTRSRICRTRSRSTATPTATTIRSPSQTRTVSSSSRTSSP